MKIRTAYPQDYELIVDFQVKMAYETEKMELNKKTVRQGVQAVFKDKSKGRYYIAENDDNEVVASLLTTFEWSDWRNGQVLWLQSVYVKPAYRRKGVFRKMYEHIKKTVLTNKQLAGIRLYVDKTNLPAQSVYNAIGMNGEHYHLYEWMK